MPQIDSFHDKTNSRLKTNKTNSSIVQEKAMKQQPLKYQKKKSIPGQQISFHELNEGDKRKLADLIEKLANAQQENKELQEKLSVLSSKSKQAESKEEKEQLKKEKPAEDAKVEKEKEEILSKIEQMKLEFEKSVQKLKKYSKSIKQERKILETEFKGIQEKLSHLPLEDISAHFDQLKQSKESSPSKQKEEKEGVETNDISVQTETEETVLKSSLITNDTKEETKMNSQFEKSTLSNPFIDQTYLYGSMNSFNSIPPAQPFPLDKFSETPPLQQILNHYKLQSAHSLQPLKAAGGSQQFPPIIENQIRQKQQQKEEVLEEPTILIDDEISRQYVELPAIQRKKSEQSLRLDDSMRHSLFEIVDQIETKEKRSPSSNLSAASSIYRGFDKRRFGREEEIDHDLISIISELNK